MLDQARLAEGAVAHRGEVVEVEVSRAGNVQLRLGAAQFVALHFQFDRVDLYRVHRGTRFRLRAQFGGGGL